MATTRAETHTKEKRGYGLQQEVLGPLETLAQSISTMAPTATATLTIPLVFATSGNGTWLSYVGATACTLIVALCIARFARESASPGSLYSYTTSSLPPALGSVAAWALLLAYIGTGASVVGGFVHYANVVFAEFLHFTAPAIPLAIFAAAVSIWIAYCDVKVSARLMVYIEVVSVLLIVFVFVPLLWQRGFHFDPIQLKLSGVNFSGVRLGMVLAMFSFVGFESATTLGEEARNPLRTIPGAVLRSVVFSGMFFILASYTEVAGFPANAGTLDQSASPLSVLSAAAGMRRFGPLIDICAMTSMFACTLACVTAAARVLLLMAHNGIVHAGLRKTHSKNETPHAAVMVTGAATLLLPIGLILGKVSGETIYDWMGSLATYGFIVVYALVALALPIHLRKVGKLTAGTVVLSALAVGAMALVLEGTLYPVPEWPKNYLPYLFLAYLACGVGWHWLSGRNQKTAA